jgi:hypothetical protein
MVSVGYVWVGDPDRARGMLASLHDAAPPLAERVQELSYLELQRMDDDAHRHGVRRYWKGHYLRELDDAAIGAFLARGDGDGGGDPALVPYGGLQSCRGAIAEVGEEETAFSDRDALVEFVAMANWTDPGRGLGADGDRGAMALRSSRSPAASMSTTSPTRGGRHPARLRREQAGPAGQAEGPLRSRQCPPPQPQHPPPQPAATTVTQRRRAPDHPSAPTPAPGRRARV